MRNERGRTKYVCSPVSKPSAPKPSLRDDISARFVAAEAVLAQVNGWAVVSDPAQHKVRLAGAAVTEGGERHVVLGHASVDIRARFSAVGLTGSEPPELVGARSLEAAESDQAVADALMFWGSHPLD